MECNVQLKEAIKIRSAMEDYQDTIYLSLIRQLNDKCEDVLKEDLGSEFVKCCSRDFAGEIVRNCFDLSEYNITVDQLVKRILEFTYEKEYDPLAGNGGVGDINKSVYNYGELQSEELESMAELMKSSQRKLFDEERDKDPLDRKGKIEYRKQQMDAEGTVYDELTGKKEKKVTYERNGKIVEKSDLQADHLQVREAASYNEMFLTNDGVKEMKLFWNSADNFQMMHQSANSSKGDVRVCEVNGKIQYVNARSKEYDANTDITYRATPEQLADATIFMWERVDENRENMNESKIQVLKDKGYLDENGKVPKYIRNKLINKIKHSQNTESKIILSNTKYDEVGKVAKEYTKNAFGKIVAGQIMYYAIPPLVYELKIILKNKGETLDGAIKKIQRAGKRISNYVFSKLSNICSNVIHNSLKKFIKSFMDILINTVKATVKKVLKITKNLVLSTVDAIRIIADKEADSCQKADAVFNLYGVTITTCVVEILFELLASSLHVPQLFEDIIFGPLQIMTTVVCTNLTLLILKKADMFGVKSGFQMSKIRALFEETRKEYKYELELSYECADTEIEKIIHRAREESRLMYGRLMECDPKKYNFRNEVQKINDMFSMNINFESDWLKFIGFI